MWNATATATAYVINTCSVCIHSTAPAPAATALFKLQQDSRSICIHIINNYIKEKHTWTTHAASAHTEQALTATTFAAEFSLATTLKVKTLQQQKLQQNPQQQHLKRKAFKATTFTTALTAQWNRQHKNQRHYSQQQHLDQKHPQQHQPHCTIQRKSTIVWIINLPKTKSSNILILYSTYGIELV